MEVRQSVLGEIAIMDGMTVAGADIGVLLRRLILFDRVIIKSVRLRELPILFQTFGKIGIQELLRSGVLSLSCEFTNIITDIHQNGVRIIPKEHFTFGIADIGNREKLLQSELRWLQSISGLKNPERTAIEETFLKSLIRPSATFGKDLLQQVNNDLRSNSPSLAVAVASGLNQKVEDAENVKKDLQITTEEVKNGVFRIKHNLVKDFGVAQENVHKTLERAVHAVVSLDHRLAEMEAYSAIPGFKNEDSRLLFGKLAGVLAPLNPSVPEEQFKRVIEIADLPDFKSGQRIEVDKLLTIRESSECRDFRSWLSKLDDKSDSEIKELVHGVRHQLARLANSTGGKAFRFAANTGLGLIPGYGTLIGIASGLVDSFLVDKMLPHSGVLAFLDEKYPSLFRSA